ncbi:hypothetical protein ILUMI_26041 [Ignelater luminosus]|uniref:WD repeat-containing protein 63 n=1 Tax=Ignelater luminosus TaxID=2038154 RepID=A0A8K0C456_IGNLU|nr:hypothetical protein ILUMI_26041 [Ignelater luminosus]
MDKETSVTISEKIQHTSTSNSFATRIIKQSSEQEGEQFPPSEVSATYKKRRKNKRKKKLDDYTPPPVFDIPGVTKITISPITQKIINCSVGEQVTAEHPWKYVPKEAIDNLELSKTSSEFSPIKSEILNYPREELLLGYIADESAENDMFYICLTEPAEKAVSEIIDKAQKEQEERLNYAVYKRAKPWKNLGSEEDVDLMLLVTNRPLLEVELEARYPVLSTKCEFRLKLARNEKLGYTELLRGKKVYENVHKKKIDSAIQVTPTVASNMAQTIYTYPTNAWTQYEYEYEEINQFSAAFEENIQSFTATKMDTISDMLNVNGLINFYTSDYINLINDYKYTRIPEAATVKPYTSFTEEVLCKRKEIISLSWHPMWTGTVAIAYSEETFSSYKQYKPNKDVINESVYSVTPVLLWSFKDTLKPRLHLETSREISVISFCPLDENILIGGCKSGQIVIWDIRNKLDDIEKEEFLTVTQQQYRVLIYSLVRWMKNVKDLNVVRPIVVSDLKYSHKSSVTSIEWFSPFREMSKLGKIEEIPEDQKRTSLQFMTASTDGSVMCWDIQIKPTLPRIAFDYRTPLRRLKQLPSALNIDVSPIKALNRTLKPFYQIQLIEPKTTRDLPLSCLNIASTALEYKEQNPDLSRKFNITDRILHKPVYNRPTHHLVNKLVAGTSLGDFLIAGWEGFEFEEEEILPKEVSKIENIAKYHDGPVISVHRSPLHSDLYLTVGGKVFALWNSQLQDRPILWRRSKCKYTQGVWNTYRPSMFRLTRFDGCVEMWHLKTRSDKCIDLKQLSGKCLTGTYTHSLAMEQNVMGIANSRGTLRLYYIDHEPMDQSENDKLNISKFCEKEVQRKLHFQKWQNKWFEKHADLMNEKKQKELLLQKEQIKREKERLAEERIRQQKEEAERKALLKPPERGKRQEWVHQQWMAKEKKRLTKVLLEQKGLDIKVLEQNQLPLTKAAEDEQTKKLKQVQRLEKASKIFDDTVAVLFPDAIEPKVPPPIDPYNWEVTVTERTEHFEEYQRIESEFQEYVSANPYIHSFNWITFLNSGKERRKTLDGYYSRTSHRSRILKEKQARIKAAKLAEMIEQEKAKTIKAACAPQSRCHHCE